MSPACGLLEVASCHEFRQAGAYPACELPYASGLQLLEVLTRGAELAPADRRARQQDMGPRHFRGPARAARRRQPLAR